MECWIGSTTISSFRSAPRTPGTALRYMCLLFAVDNKSAQCHGYTRFISFFFVFNGTHIPDSGRQKLICIRMLSVAFSLYISWTRRRWQRGYICSMHAVFVSYYFFCSRTLAAFETFCAWSRLAHYDRSRYEMHRQSRRLDMIIIVYFSIHSSAYSIRFHPFLSRAANWQFYKFAVENHFARM